MPVLHVTDNPEVCQLFDYLPVCRRITVAWRDGRWEFAFKAETPRILDAIDHMGKETAAKFDVNNFYIELIF